MLSNISRQWPSQTQKRRQLEKADFFQSTGEVRQGPARSGEVRRGAARSRAKTDVNQALRHPGTQFTQTICQTIQIT